MGPLLKRCCNNNSVSKSSKGKRLIKVFSKDIPVGYSGVVVAAVVAGDAVAAVVVLADQLE